MDGNTQHTRAAALGLWTTLALLTAVVASRRFAGAYTGPLPTGVLAVAVLLAVTASVAALWLFRRDRSAKGDPALGKAGLPGDIIAWSPEITAWGLPTLFTLTIAAQPTAAQLGTLLALSAMGAISLGIAVLETTVWWQTLLSEPPITPPLPTPLPVVSSEPTFEPIATEEEPIADDEQEVADESTTQWMTRRKEADGESIEGTVRVEFASGQREAVLHVTFCPPLSAVPEVEFECVDGEDWQIKPEAALPYGLRIQVRRSTAVTPEQTGLIAYLATSSRTAKAA